MSPVEAQLVGMPVVCFDNGAMRETVQHGVTGIVAKTDAEFVEAVRYYSKKVISQEERQRCRDWAMRFTLERFVARYEELCQEALTTGGW